ncbi:MAG: hypothetical protein ACHQ1D_06530 [Nitrososphaerales archaeon]
MSSSSGIDIKFVQDTYQRMTDGELIRIATEEAYGLTPEAIEIVKAEIQKRGLDQNIAKGVEAQNKTWTIQEVDAYCDIISKLSCPTCGGTTARLNATITGEVMSFIIFTTYSKKLKIGCGNCLDNATTNALAKTILLGWWGIPWGLIRTPLAIALNFSSKRTNQLQDHNDHLRSFVLSNVGVLETYKNDREKLQQIVAKQNGV